MINSTMKALIKKDLHQHRAYVIPAIAASIVAIIVFCTPGLPFIILGSILLLTSIMALYTFLVMTSVIAEHKEKHVNFVMTLPITSAQYSWTKFISCSVSFFCCLSIIATIFYIAIFATGHLSGFTVCYYTAIFGLMVPAFYLLLAVALIVQKEGWTIAAFVFINIFITILVNLAPNAPIIQHAFAQGTLAEIGVHWIPLGTTVIFIEMVMSCFFIVCITLTLKNRKQFVPN